MWLVPDFNLDNQPKSQSANVARFVPARRSDSAILAVTAG